MKTSVELLTEYASKYGQRGVAELCGVKDNTVTNWKQRGRMTPAATVKVGLELGYSYDFLTKIVAIEQEQSEEGRSFLTQLAEALYPAVAMAGSWRKR
ncbi:hypothetical protein [Chitinolyticbacter meiyuanensis]|uniref:hypothetical protein n=1 Tax=Chitinolyticbacter meiyuanensis TaxID=682798 RepID=UPI0011E5C07D|nr:hypothetical protein [Chitinolyticbacter meiyuanensis]